MCLNEKSHQEVTEKTFSAEKEYCLLSPDGTRVLQATNQKSSYAGLGQDALDFAAEVTRIFTGVRLPLPHFGGFSLEFGDTTPQAGVSTPSRFIFSGGAGGYRMHSRMHNNKMLFMLGISHPREWVVWDSQVPTNGDWEVLELVWNGPTVKIKGHAGQYVKWSVSGFVATHHEEEATEFVLREA